MHRSQETRELMKKMDDYLALRARSSRDHLVVTKKRKMLLLVENKKNAERLHE